ncbi:MAG: hypothetical protein CGW95_14670, partial [Phenylobacterium zucineum]
RAGPARPGFTDRLKPNIQPTPSASNAENVVGSTAYKPYGFLPSGTIGEGCDVCWWMEGTETIQGIEFQYRFLMQVGYVGDQELRLFLPDSIVVIEGQRLTDLRKKLARRMVTFIKQHNPRVWGLPPTDEPMIERVQILRPEMFKNS